MEHEQRERLDAYERMLTDLQAEKEKILSDMDALRQAGKTKTATYQQLLVNKLTVQNLLGRFALYGLQPRNNSLRDKLDDL
ncbi:MAG: hypothetical protein RR288_07035 [Oscillibacter sp.]